MSKLFRLFYISIFIIISNGANAENGFVSDDVYTYIHSGPSAKFRILGSINAGTPITIIEVSADSEFTKISDNKAREGWIMTKFVATKPSLKQEYALLELSLNDQIAANDDLSRKILTITEQKSQLQNNINALTDQLVKAKSELLATQDKVQFESEEIKIQWLTRGGLLVLVSFIIGLIVCSLISKKKSKNPWS